MWLIIPQWEKCGSSMQKNVGIQNGNFGNCREIWSFVFKNIYWCGKIDFRIIKTKNLFFFFFFFFYWTSMTKSGSNMTTVQSPYRRKTTVYVAYTRLSNLSINLNQPCMPTCTTICLPGDWTIRQGIFFSLHYLWLQDLITTISTKKSLKCLCPMILKRFSKVPSLVPLSLKARTPTSR